MLQLWARLSPHHRHVLAGLVRGEDSEADSEAGGGEARHQHGDDGAHAGRGLGGARHEEGEGDVLYPAQYETLGVVSGDVEPHFGPAEEEGGGPGPQSGLVAEHSDSTRCSEQEPQSHPVFAGLSHRPVAVPGEVRK